MMDPDELQNFIDTFTNSNEPVTVAPMPEPAPAGNPSFLGGGDENGVPFFYPDNPPPGREPFMPPNPGDATRNFSDLVARNQPAPTPSVSFGDRDRSFLPFNPEQPYAVPDL